MVKERALTGYRFDIPDVEVRKSDLEPAGAYLVDQIKRRAAQGLDYAGRPFAPYSPSSGKSGSIVNLRGESKAGKTHMIDALDFRTTIEPQSAQLDVGIFDDEVNAMKAQIINEGKRIKTRNAGLNKRRKFKGIKDYLVVPARRFLDFSGNDLDKVKTMVTDSIMERITKE